MPILINQLRFAAARIAPNRGLVVGAMLAFGAVAAQDATDVITIDNFTFTPKELTVAVGTTIKWVNHDDIPHTVVEKKTTFRSKALDTDDSYSFTFTTAGTSTFFAAFIRTLS